ncbi:MAG: CaiB/BaiF CoA-transferase family protein [Enterobacterales bacterium]|nr:CaiB/BaiF CoA-transferase family protein [Enterobacterales bacterium]
MNNKNNTGPLTGLKVLDLSRILAGPWATQMLADYGAEVWKIERPGQGDDTRAWGGGLSSNGETIDASAYFLCANRGKYSLSLDIASQQGQQIIRQLLTEADILVENFKWGSLQKYGLDYASLKKEFPRLIYCSITGFGHTGPFADQAGYDAMIQASAGLMSINGEAGGAPQKVGVAVSDLSTGLYAVTAILAALYHREKTGQGQQIDLALFDTQVACLANQSINYLVSGNIPKPMGSSHPSIVPYQAMPCQDGAIMLAIGNDKQFQMLCLLLNQAQWGNDERFATNNQRVKNKTLLLPLLEQELKQNSCQHWLTLLASKKVPCGPINNLKQVFEHPQIAARQMQFDLMHQQLGAVPQVANPVKFSQTPIEYNKPPPLLGEDTHSILSDKLSFSQTEIAELTQLGII